MVEKNSIFSSTKFNQHFLNAVENRERRERKIFVRMCWCDDNKSWMLVIVEGKAHASAFPSGRES
jgi:hypothetical protein